MGKRLLMIDDDISADPGTPTTGGYMWYYAQALHDLGYELIQAHTVDRANEELGRQQFDLILLDVMMPPGKSLATAAAPTWAFALAWFSEIYLQRIIRIPPSSSSPTSRTRIAECTAYQVECETDPCEARVPSLRTC